MKGEGFESQDVRTYSPDPHLTTKSPLIASLVWIGLGPHPIERQPMPPKRRFSRYPCLAPSVSGLAFREGHEGNFRHVQRIRGEAWEGGPWEPSLVQRPEGTSQILVDVSHVKPNRRTLFWDGDLGEANLGHAGPLQTGFPFD